MILNVGGCDGNHYDGWRKGVTVSGHGASVDQEPVAGHRRWSGVWLQELVTSHLVHSSVQLQHQGFNMSLVQLYNFDIFPRHTPTCALRILLVVLPVVFVQIYVWYVHLCGTL